jgi:hypothetical protein
MLSQAPFVSAANRVLDLHNLWTTRTRQAVEQWILVGKKKRLVKDVIGIIARLVWESRKEGMIVMNCMPMLSVLLE